MKTIKTTVYTFDELSADAQRKALDASRSFNVDYDWWQSTYEDAENIGLNITSFDLDRNRHAEGEFTLSAAEVAANIIRDHGVDTETYKTATKFLSDHNPVFAEYMEKEGPELEGKLMDIEADFLKSLLDDYSIMLQKESEYLQSDEAVKENILSNEYTFEADGTMNNGPAEAAALAANVAEAIAEAEESDARRFLLIYTEGGRGENTYNPNTRTASIDEFTEVRGYDDADITALKALDISETWASEYGNHVVVRLDDAKGGKA